MWLRIGDAGLRFIGQSGRSRGRSLEPSSWKTVLCALREAIAANRDTHSINVKIQSAYTSDEQLEAFIDAIQRIDDQQGSIELHEGESRGELYRRVFGEGRSQSLPTRSAAALRQIFRLLSFFLTCAQE
ncbi:hypothetical protein CPA50_15405 [Marinobacter sp. ANT_B65]|nr:hypothetical protein CPA50_15405 [Marinobacter sp. ANT_B65]